MYSHGKTGEIRFVVSMTFLFNIFNFPEKIGLLSQLLYGTLVSLSILKCFKNYFSFVNNLKLNFTVML